VTSGELARLAGVSVDTLHHYEAKGVLPGPERRANAYRAYPPKALDRVRLIRRALAIGFTLDELAEILTTRDSGGAPCRKVRRMVGEKLEQLEKRIEELIALRDQMKETIEEWDAALEQTSDGDRAHLLERLK
jgi:DNA-binding transcriptional MerR regulator